MKNNEKKYTDMQLTAFIIACIVITYVITSMFYIGLGKSMIQYRVEKMLKTEYLENGTLYDDVNYFYVNKTCNVSSCQWVNLSHLRENLTIIYPNII